MKIAFTGWAGSGKTKAAEYLKSKYDCEIISFADGIKYIDKYLFGNGKKNRSRLQAIGEFFRGLDPDVWTNRTVDVVSDNGNDFIIDDLRRSNEYLALIKSGFRVFRTVADESVRVERLIARDGECDVSIMYNDSENGCANLQLTEIDNNGTLEEFYANIDKVMDGL